MGLTPPPPPAASGYLRRLILEGSAIVLDDNKDYLLQARLAPLLEREGLTSWDQLVSRLRAPGASSLRRQVIEAMTTHETSFFRDVHPFEALRAEVLPRLLAAHPGPVTIWSAAASSGQEIYSIAFLVAQHLGERDRARVRLLATDLSSDILARARDGRFNQLEINRGLPAPLLVRFFERHGADWRIKEEIRRMIDFRLLNLAEPWPILPAMDVVFLRNVLIYFDAATKRAILARVATAMRPGGILFLGGVETTNGFSDRFVERRYGRTTCYERLP